MTTAPGVPAAEAAVTVRGLTVIRGGRRALDGVDLDVPPGQVVGLLGPSGSGKTTLMRSIVGVQVIGSGSVTVLGLPGGHPRLRSRVGYVTQVPSVYPDLTVRQNLQYLARIAAVDDVAVDRALDRVDLRAEADRRVHTLSGGEAGRVSLAAALVADPDLLVLDEPTVGLDPVLRRDLWRLFRELAGAGATVVVSSHVMDEAARCDRLVLLRDGRVLADDTLQALLQRTGAEDAEGAFLALVEGAEGGR